jgi:hypothetical protein
MFAALEPVVCAEIMQLHHQKHHAAYVANFNIAEEKLKEAVVKSERRIFLVGGHCRCKEMPVITVNRVVDTKRIIGKMESCGGGEAQGVAGPPPTPHPPKNSNQNEAGLPNGLTNLGESLPI